MWSLANEMARHQLLALGSVGRSRVTRTQNQPSWLKLLAEAEQMLRPLCFTETAPDLFGIDGGTTLVCGSATDAWRSACCGDHLMRMGKHYAEFTITARTGTPCIGVVGSNFDPRGSGLPSDYTPSAMFWPADRPYLTEWGSGCERALQFSCHEIYEDGAVLGLLLDFTKGSLVAYLNGQRQGVLVSSGIKGPAKWAVESPHLIQATWNMMITCIWLSTQARRRFGLNPNRFLLPQAWRCLQQKAWEAEASQRSIPPR